MARTFSSLKPEDIQNLLSKKESISVLKIITNNGQTGKVYCAAKVPLFFQFNSQGGLFPTVFTLWHHPELLYTFKTHSAVISKLASGANLMLPGVITDVPVNFYSYGKLQKGTPVAVITEDNKVIFSNFFVVYTYIAKHKFYYTGPSCCWYNSSL